MQLYIKQKVFSWVANFNVTDEQQQTVYKVQGEIFSWGHKLHIFDASGNEVAMISQKLMSWLPKYNINIGGHEIILTKELTFLKPKYRLEGSPWSLEGDFWNHDYKLVDGSNEIMSIRKEWFTWGDTYELTIHEPKYHLLALAITLAVDCVLASEKGN